MLKYHFLIAFRHFAKNRSFAVINLIGLVLGIVSCVLILQYVFFEQSYDRFYEKKERMYRVTSSRYTDGIKQYDKAKAFIPLGKTLADEFPEVESYVTLFPIFSETDVFISYEMEGDEAKVFREKDIFHVRGNVFEVFELQLLKGSPPADALLPGTVYISASMASKYFGEENPVGKMLGNSLYEDYKVAGVFADMPANSHIHFNFVFPWETLTPYDDTHWKWDGFLTYITLSAGAGTDAFTHKLASFADKLNDHALFGQLQYQLGLQSVQNIHLHSNLVGEVEPNGNSEITYILLALAALVLLIAWVNYVNLSTAKLLDRGKEMAVRKIVGSHQRHLVLQLLTESLLLNSLAALIARLVVAAVLPYYSEFTAIPLDFEIFQTAGFWLPFLFIFLGGSVGSGIIPALMFSSFEPISMLKGRFGTGMMNTAAFLRSSLVVFQLVISLMLILGSMVAYKQVNLMNKLDEKVDKDNVVVVRTLELPSPPGADSLFVQKIEAFKNSLHEYPFIEGATLGSGVPGLENQLKASWFRRSLEDEQALTMEVNRVDFDFMELFKPEIIAGRNFSKAFSTDKNACLINMEALKQLGFSSPEEALEKGMIVGANGEKKEIVGVIDYQTMASKYKAAPEVYLMNFGPAHYVAIKVSADAQQSIPAILENL